MATGLRPTADVSTPDAAEVTAKASLENFPVALLVLPRPTRRHLNAVYGFARLVDDAGDEAPGDRARLLAALRTDLDRVYTGVPEHPLMQRLAPTVRELGLPRAPFERLIDANEQDQIVSRYETYAELERYCALSANPVGQLVLNVFGRASTERLGWSDSVCTGLQLAEHWQDVGEDHRRGRIYLPQEDLRRHGVSEDDLARGPATTEFGELMAFEVDRAHRLLDAGVPLARSLRGRERLAIAGYVGGGRAALDAVQRSGCEVLGEPPKASRALRAQRIVATLREASGRR